MVVPDFLHGKITLNKIETGTICNLSELTERLIVILADRDRTAILPRGVIIDSQGKVAAEDLQKLVEQLSNAKASPIRIIKNSNVIP